MASNLRKQLGLKGKKEKVVEKPKPAPSVTELSMQEKLAELIAKARPATIASAELQPKATSGLPGVVDAVKAIVPELGVKYDSLSTETATPVQVSVSIPPATVIVAERPSLFELGKQAKEIARQTQPNAQQTHTQQNQQQHKKKKDKKPHDPNKPKKEKKRANPPDPNLMIKFKCGCELGILQFPNQSCAKCQRKAHHEWLERRRQKGLDTGKATEVSRLPNGSKYDIGAYDGDKQEWTGSLTIPIENGAPIVFTQTWSGIIRLLKNLDGMYREWLKVQEQAKETSIDEKSTTS